MRRPPSRTNSRRPLNSSVVGIRRRTSRSTRLWRVGRLGVAAQRAVGHVEEQPAEDEDHRLDRLDECQAGDNRQPSQHERTDDADRDHATSQLGRHREVGEQEREDKDVVERQ